MSVNSNPTIDIPMISSEWEIEINSAIQYYTEYIADLQALDNGIPFSQLGYSEKRQASWGRIYSLDQRRFTEQRLSDFDNTPMNSIAVIRIEGAMRVSDGFSSQGMRSVAQEIANADANPNIIGLIMEMNSGGGEALAGTMVQKAIGEFSKTSVALVHLAASAAYKAILQCDKIVAYAQESRVGSIGTMASINKRVLAYVSENIQELYATKSEKKNIEFRELQKGNEGPIIEQLDKVNEFFLQEVKAHRDISGTEQMVDDVFSGALMNAVEGYQVGLVDSIGTLTHAIDVVNAINEGLIKRKQPDNSGIYKQNISEMNFKQFKINLIQAVNDKLGLSLEQTTSEDQLIEAINGAQSVSELSSQVQAIQAQLDDFTANQSNADADEGNQGDEGNGGDATQETQEESNETEISQLIAEMKQMREEFDKVYSQKQALQSTVVKLKAAKSDQDGGEGSGKGNSAGTDYATIRRYNQSVELEGKSEF